MDKRTLSPCKLNEINSEKVFTMMMMMHSKVLSSNQLIV